MGETSLSPINFHLPGEGKVESTTTLLDTGSGVSTITSTFYHEVCKPRGVELQPLGQLLEVETASGDLLGYSGMVELEISIPGLTESLPALFLVTNDTNFSQKVPVNLGTNVLRQVRSRAKEQHGERFLQKGSWSDTWYLALRCLSMQERSSVK